MPRNGLAGICMLTSFFFAQLVPLNHRYLAFLALMVLSAPNWCVAAYTRFVPTDAPLLSALAFTEFLNAADFVRVLPPVDFALVDCSHLTPSGLFSVLNLSMVEVLSPYAMARITSALSTSERLFSLSSSPFTSPSSFTDTSLITTSLSYCLW